MDAREAKKEYQDIKTHADFDDYGLIFCDKWEKLFIKKLLWSQCKEYHYSDIEYATMIEDNRTVDKGHPIAGSIIGNAATGTFGGGFAGALIGQQMGGNEKEYYYYPRIVIQFKDGYKFYKCIYHGELNANSLTGRMFKKSFQQISDQLDHAQGFLTQQELFEQTIEDNS